MTAWTELLARGAHDDDAFVAAARALPWRDRAIAPAYWDSIGSDDPAYDEAEWERRYGYPQQDTLDEVTSSFYRGAITHDVWARILYGDVEAAKIATQPDPIGELNERVRALREAGTVPG